ncbi:MAG TPA: OmpH family outer membrane protein [Gammaproteobacteria bacterium]|nr:OmpH family outer membrane protein [Gammaproteobacteria bacterium]
MIFALAAAPLALAASHNTKVGVIDPQSVLQRSHAGQEVMQQIRAYGKQLQSQMGPEKDKLQKEEQDLQRNAKIESKAQQKKAQATFQGHVKAYQTKAQQARKSFQEKRAALMIPLQAKLQDVVSKYAKEHGFGLVLDSQAAIYNASGLDITDAVLKAFNKAQPHAPAPDTAAAAQAVESGGSGN